MNASDLWRVAFTNQYSDLDWIPSETVVNNATVTFKKNWTTVQTITNNQATDAEVNYEITKVDVWLWNVDNTSDINKPVSNAVSIELSKKANKTEVYTKAETDAAISASISSVYKYKWSKENLSQIQAIVEKANGDVWNAEDTDINYAWNWNRWDPLWWTIDLSWYLTKAEASTTYLPSANAAALYLSKTDASNTYLSKTDASNTYLSQSSASQNYATKTEVAEAIESVDWISTDQPSNPSTGSIYYDTTDWVAKVYNWTYWVEIWSGNVIAMTQQEYDNLSAAEKADGKLRIITDAPQISIPSAEEIDSKANKDEVLTKTNTTEFTPTWNYQPATKKYVDDSISQAWWWDMLASVYDPNNIAANVFDYANFINTPTIPTNVSDLNNDSWYQTASDVSSAISSAVDLSNYLAKNNTTSYTPSWDYNPATKKYVDDIVWNINTILASI